MKILENPKSNEYLSLKELILGDSFLWTYGSSTPGMSKEGHEDIPTYGHAFLIRPEDSWGKYPQINCNIADQCIGVLISILRHNNIEPNLFLRVAANAVHPTENNLPSVPHVDHADISHRNILVYLTPTYGGYVSCKGNTHCPEEDDVVLFRGEHFLQPPSKGRRVCIVGTFI